MYIMRRDFALINPIACIRLLVVRMSRALAACHPAAPADPADPADPALWGDRDSGAEGGGGWERGTPFAPSPVM